MVKSIEELKAIVTDGMNILNKSGGLHATIKRYPNNIIMVHGKSIPWTHLQEILATSDLKLDIKESQETLFQDKTKKHGGRRLGAGRKKIDEYKKKRPASFAISRKAAIDLKCLSKYLNMSKSQIIEQLIQGYDEQLSKNDAEYENFVINGEWY